MLAHPTDVRLRLGCDLMQQVKRKWGSKSSSGFGTVMRALGHGYKAGVVQFIKGTWECGERNFLGDTPRLEYYVMGTGFTWETQDADLDKKAAEKVWEACEH